MRRIRDMLIFVAATAGVAVPAVVVGLGVGTTMLASPDVALASPQAVIRDCAKDGKLDQHYSLSDLKKAEKKLPTDIDEYSNCRDVINQAEVSGSGPKSHGAANGPAPGAGGGNGGGPSPGDTQALKQATGQGGKPPSLSLHGEKVVPGSGGVFKTASAANTLPVPVLLALVAVAALMAAGGFVALRRRFPEVVGAARRIFRR